MAGRQRTRARLRAWFDATMDRGTPALVAWLGLGSLLLVALVTLAVDVLDPRDTAADNRGVLGVAWMALLRTLDPGTMGGDTGGPVFLGLMLTVTIGGIFIVSALIGVLTTGLENRLTELRKGRSPVVIRGHTVLLGWSEQVFTIVSELVAANQANRRTSVVILADRDKVDMQDQLRARVGGTGRLRVICRSGSPLKRIDLELVSLDTAGSVVVLSPLGDDPDIDVIKALLLLHNRPWPQQRPHVVAAIQESHNMAAARLAAGPHAQLVDADDISVRLVVQSHRQPGLSTVYTDLLEFDGNEIYLKPEPTLAGRTFGEALQAYELGCPIGLQHSDGTFRLNPASSLVIGSSDQMIVVAEDETLIRLADQPRPFDETHIVDAPEPDHRPDRTLFLGWNARGHKALDLLDRLVAPGSVADVAAPEAPPDLDAPLWTNLSVGFKRCDPVSRPQLEALEMAGYQHIVVLSDDRLPPDAADDRTLVTLLHLRDIEAQYGDPYAIVTEMNDDTNREVAQVTKAEDFIVSTRLISLLLTQLSQNRHLQPILGDLFDPAGAEIKLARATDYVTTDGTAVTFATVVEAARRKGETAIGYRLHRRRDQPPHYGVVLNPPKTGDLSFTDADSLVLIADD
jgi:voltage-gated potassium channel Kch